MNTETYQVQILIYLFLYLFTDLSQKLSRKIFLQALGVVPVKRCSENMKQIYRRTHMLKCDFNKVATQLD